MNQPIFVITARGGSKGIPRKNIKPLAGKPLIAYSIEVALALTTQDRVIVSTDDEEIAAVSRQYGIERPHMRPAELATDTTGSREVIIDAMDCALARGLEFDYVVLLQPTSPFRIVEDVEKTMAAWSPDIDLAVTVVEAACNPYYDGFEVDGNGFLHISKGEGLYTRRQQAPTVWQTNGAVYAFTPDSLRRYKLGELPKRVGVEMPAIRSLDLDTPTDWVVAEAMMAYLAQQKK
jgi:N-acylneuraminate cytidylyltransferase